MWPTAAGRNTRRDGAARPARLVERSEERGGRSYRLNPAVTTIGRDEENDVVASDHVSRRHAEVRWDGARFVLHDLGSKNGTLLGKVRIARTARLADLDELRVGSARLTVRILPAGGSTQTLGDG